MDWYNPNIFDLPGMQMPTLPAYKQPDSGIANLAEAIKGIADQQRQRRMDEENLRAAEFNRRVRETELARKQKEEENLRALQGEVAKAYEPVLGPEPPGGVGPRSERMRSPEEIDRLIEQQVWKYAPEQAMKILPTRLRTQTQMDVAGIRDETARLKIGATVEQAKANRESVEDRFYAGLASKEEYQEALILERQADRASREALKREQIAATQARAAASAARPAKAGMDADVRAGAKWLSSDAYKRYSRATMDQEGFYAAYDVAKAQRAANKSDATAQITALYKYISGLDQSVVRPSELILFNQANTLMENFRMAVARVNNPEEIRATTDRVMEDMKSIMDRFAVSIEAKAEQQRQYYSETMKGKIPELPKSGKAVAPAAPVSAPKGRRMRYDPATNKFVEEAK